MPPLPMRAVTSYGPRRVPGVKDMAELGRSGLYRRGLSRGYKKAGVDGCRQFRRVKPILS